MPTDTSDHDIAVRVVGYRATANGDAVSVTVRRGERVGLAGASGSGKTTLLRWIAGYPPGADHRVECQARMVAKRVAYVPQQTVASLSPFLRSRTQVRLVAGAEGYRTAELLRSVGLTNERLQRAHPSEMSGGERQRVLWAQAMAMSPDLFVADEPTADLDYETASEVLRVVDRTLRERNAGLLIASHDESVFERIGCSRVVRLTPPAGDDVAMKPSLKVDRASEGPVVTAADVTKTWNGRVVLNGASLRIAAGELVAICGASGSGKSTLAACLAGLLSFDSGRVEYHSELRREAVWRRVQVVEQHASQSLNPRQRVREAAMECGSERAFELLDRFEISADTLERRTAQLSEGQRSRVAMARHVAAVAARGLLVLDESLSALDDATALRVLSVLRAEQQQRGLAVVWITHQLRLAHLVADRLLTMKEGRLAA